VPLLFAYGTLQQESVQLSTFGRTLEGERDELVGFELAVIELDDPALIASSGKRYHPIVRFNGRTECRVPGTAFELSEDELVNADRYEVAVYTRVGAMLASGRPAWVYVDLKFMPESLET